VPLIAILALWLYTHEASGRVYGSGVWKTVGSARRMEVFRLVEASGPNADYSDFPARLNIQQPPVEAPANWVGQVRQTLSAVLETNSSPLASGKACEPQPRILIRIYGQGRTTDLFLCFDCNEYSFAAPGPQPRAFRDFDAERPVLVRLLLQVLPHDKEVQALSPNGQG
jgi:hypothetical protein